MTEKELRSLVVNTAIKYLGCKESDGSHKKIIDLYNSQKPLPVGYKVIYYDAWCAAFVSAVAYELGLTDIIFPECGCGRMRDLYIKKGGWVENDAYVPEPADLIMYDWDDSGSGDNKGGIEHVGMVVSVTGSTIKVIEGNKNDSVAYRSIPVNGRYIRGFCCPDYAKKAKTYKATTTEQKTVSAKVPYLKQGDKGECVKRLQTFLIALGYGVGSDGADGDFGGNTLSAVKKYQTDNKLSPDGIVGADTWGSIVGL